MSGGIDFSRVPLTATFASGMTMSNVSIPVIMDNIVELQEEFNLILNVPSSLGPAITIDGRNTAVGVITDSTGKNVISISYKDDVIIILFNF